MVDHKLNSHQAVLDPFPREISPRRTTVVILVSVAAGLLLAVLWSAKLVDTAIGETVADGLLGHNAKAGAVGSGVSGAIFAFVAGLAGTFTACNIAAFSAVGPMMAAESTARGRMRRALPQLGWLSLGVVLVSGLYGAVGAAIGDSLPQLSARPIGSHAVPERLIQSSVIFTVLGIAFGWLGLAALKVLPDPLRAWTRRFPAAPSLVMGFLIAGFLIGRPYPLFYKLFQEAAKQHNALFGAGTFILTALGNIVVLGVLFLALAALAGPRYQAWLTARPYRVPTLVGAGLLIGGAFMVFYWGVRLPAHFDYGWFPQMPYNS